MQGQRHVCLTSVISLSNGSLENGCSFPPTSPDKATLLPSGSNLASVPDTDLVYLLTTNLVYELGVDGVTNKLYQRAQIDTRGSMTALSVWLCPQCSSSSECHGCSLVRC